MRKRLIRILLLGGIAFVILLYIGGGWALYDYFGAVKQGCSGKFLPDNPAAFTLDGLDAEPYLMPDYSDVQFPARDSSLLISAFYVPPASATDPVIILVHGINSCKQRTLLPAGMLHRHGYGALMLDLRNMGTSQVDNGHMAGGAKEYKDIMGAVDWLINEQGIAPERIGLYGFSLGGATSLIAYGKDSRIQALWIDSSFADVENVVDERLSKTSFGFMKSMAQVIGRVVYQDDPFGLQPLDVMDAIGQRPVYLVHGTTDTVVLFREMGILDAALTAANVPHTTWESDSAHVRTMYDYADEYESRLVAYFDEYLR